MHSYKVYIVFEKKNLTKLQLKKIFTLSLFFVLYIIFFIFSSSSSKKRVREREIIIFVKKKRKRVKYLCNITRKETSFVLCVCVCFLSQSKFECSGI